MKKTIIAFALATCASAALAAEPNWMTLDKHNLIDANSARQHDGHYLLLWAKHLTNEHELTAHWVIDCKVLRGTVSNVNIKDLATSELVYRGESPSEKIVDLNHTQNAFARTVLFACDPKMFGTLPVFRSSK